MMKLLEIKFMSTWKKKKLSMKMKIIQSTWIKLQNKWAKKNRMKIMKVKKGNRMNNKKKKR